MITIQEIDYQAKKVTLQINNVGCTFVYDKGLFLYVGNSLLPLTPFVRGSRALLYWKVASKQVSYNQIRLHLKNYAQKMK